jgi:hypothetical protein
MHERPRRIELDSNGVGVKRHRPEQSTGWNLGSIIMDLLRCVRRSNWTGEDVHSYETEHALMEVPILRNELALHETHVGLKCECLGELRAGSAASDPVQPDVALEISDLRWLVERGKWRGRRLRRKVGMKMPRGMAPPAIGLGAAPFPLPWPAFAPSGSQNARPAALMTHAPTAPGGHASIRVTAFRFFNESRSRRDAGASPACPVARRSSPR